MPCQIFFWQMYRSSSRNGLQSTRNRSVAGSGALWWRVRHVFVTGSQEHWCKCDAVSFLFLNTLELYISFAFLLCPSFSLKVTGHDPDHRSHCATSLALRLGLMLAMRSCKVPHIVAYTEVYRRRVPSQVVELRPVRKRYVSPITGLQFSDNDNNMFV